VCRRLHEDLSTRLTPPSRKRTVFRGALKYVGGPITLDTSQALDRFLANVERRAFRMAQFATRDHDEALDIVQDTMFKLVQRYADRGEAEWGPLFYKILQSRIQDWHRRNWVRNKWRVWFNRESEEGTLEENPIDLLPDSQTKDPYTQATLTQAGEAINQALELLPLRQRQAFLLRAWEGFSVAQTAEAMGCSEGSVKTHYSRAIHSLRHHIADHV